MKLNEIAIKNLIEQIYRIVNSPVNNRETDADLLFYSVWLGNKYAAHDPLFLAGNKHRKKIDVVINGTSDVPNIFPNISYTTIPLTGKTVCYRDSLELLELGAFKINQAVRQNRGVLVHCKRGHHRSAAIIVYYLMKYCHISLINAIRFVKKRRPTTFRRMNCLMNILIKYEVSRLGYLS